METITITVEGMSCQHCVKAVESALTQLDGVQSAAVSLENNTAKVAYDSARVSLKRMKAAIEAQGYDVP